MWLDLKHGQRFTRWRVIAEAMRGRHQCAAVVCDCGTVQTRRAQELASGKSRSCGCIRRETAAKRLLTVMRWTKITNAAVTAIRTAVGIPQRQLAREHGITQSHVSLIRSGKVRAGGAARETAP